MTVRWQRTSELMQWPEKQLGKAVLTKTVDLLLKTKTKANPWYDIIFLKLTHLL